MKSRSDQLVALGLLVLGQVEVALTGVDGNPVAAHLLWAVVALAALYRRSHPFVFALVCVGGLVPVAWLELVPAWSVIFPVAAPLSVFGVGLYGKRMVPSAISAIGFALASILIVWINQLSGEAGHSYLGFEWVRLITIYLGAAGAGILLRDRTETLESTRLRYESLPPAQSAIEAEVADSRQQVAREVHSVVRRYLDRVQISVEIALERLDKAPAASRSAAGKAREESHKAMEEMRRMLGLLRMDSGAVIPTSATAPIAAPPDGFIHRAAKLAARQALFLLALLNGVVNAILIADVAPQLGGEDLAPVWRLAGATVTAALFIPRRHWPLVTVIGVPISLFVRTWFFGDLLPLDFFVWSAAFVAAAYLRPLPVAVAGGLFVIAASVGTAWAIEPETPWQAFVAFSVTTTVVWAVGAACRDRIRQTTEIEELEAAECLRRKQAALMAIREQKLGVARELHDLVGHSLTAITLQCAGVERLIPSDLPRAKEVLLTVDRLGTDANRELSELLVALSGVRGPILPSLDSLPALAEQIRERGTRIELIISGDFSKVEAGPGAAAYRIVQESLVNASKHSDGPVKARVNLLRDRIEFQIENPETGVSGAGFRFGLIGIRERAEAYGGHLEAGPDGRGFWRVQAEVPVSPTTISPLS